MAVSYEFGKLLSTLCLMNTQVLLAKVHSMILLSYCFSSLVACADENERRQLICTSTTQSEQNTSVTFFSSVSHENDIKTWPGVMQVCFVSQESRTHHYNSSQRNAAALIIAIVNDEPHM